MTTASDFDRVVLEFMADDPLIAYYISVISGEYDPSTGTSPTTTIMTPVQALLLDLTKTTNGLSVKFGTEVVEGDKELFVRPPEKTDIYASPLVINTAADRIKIGNVEYKIANMKEVNPSAANVILYDFHIRR